VTVDDAGQIYGVENIDSNRVFQITPYGELSFIAGLPGAVQKKDRERAREEPDPMKATFTAMHDIVLGSEGSLYIADTHNYRVQKLDRATGRLSTVAGTGVKGVSGDGGPADEAEVGGIFSISFSPDFKRLYLTDLANRRIRVVDMETKLIDTFAGNGENAVPEDGALASETSLRDPRAVLADRKGNVYIAARSGHSLAMVDREGRIRTVVNASGKKGYSGDGGPAIEAQMHGPKHLALDEQNRVIIADAENHVIRRYDPETGLIELLAGIPDSEGAALTDDPRTTQLARPHGVRVKDGWLYIADSYNNRVLRFPYGDPGKREQPVDADSGQRETHESPAIPPKGGVEVAQGDFFSTLLNKEVPYRVFCRENLTWAAEPAKGRKPAGLPMAIYVLNIETPAPRPSSASDRAIIEDLIGRGFLVATVDFTGAKVSDHEEWIRDILALIHVFGGSGLTHNEWHSENYLKFLNLPGPNEGREILSIPFNEVDVPIHENRIYVLPPGYTVKNSHVINKDFGVSPTQPVLFMDIVYPMPGKETQKLPVVVAQTATGSGLDVMNNGTFVFYSWLFNGYALAVHCNVKLSGVPLESGKYPIVQAIRYLRGNKDTFSLNGIVGTTGISKSSTRTWLESYFRGMEPVIKDGAFPEESSEVSINWPTCSHTLSSEAILSNLSKDSPALILTWGPYNNKGTDDGNQVEPARRAYLAKGLEDKLFYRQVPQQGHEYSVYILNDVMAFWDKFCKSDQR
jgi:sugar lactone lactonase YvrE